MAEYKMIALSRAAKGRDQEYQDWYQKRHVSDVLKLPGVTAAQTYSIGPSLGDAGWTLLAVYNVETDDPAKTLGELQSRIGTPEMPITEALDPSSVALFFAEPLGSPIAR